MDTFVFKILCQLFGYSYEDDVFFGRYLNSLSNIYNILAVNSFHVVKIVFFLRYAFNDESMYLYQ